MILFVIITVDSSFLSSMDFAADENILMKHYHMVKGRQHSAHVYAPIARERLSTSKLDDPFQFIIPPFRYSVIPCSVFRVLLLPDF
jgi:hypothetical protein